MLRSRAFVAPLLLCAGMAFGQNIGPSTTTPPYVLPNAALGAAASTTSILTVGQSVGGYTFIGIPDGMGGYDNGDGTFTLAMNHELGATSGTARAHGSAGAFVSRWVIRTDTANLEVVSGRDHNTSASDVFTWNGTAFVAGTTAWGRFCSGDLAAPGAYRFGDLGTDARIHMNGEESGAEGRGVAHVFTGDLANTSWQLPRIGRFSWENSVASPFAQEKTLVIGTDDSTPGEVYLYVGTKTNSGNDIERAGLTNGNLYAVRVAGVTIELRAAPIADGTRFDLYNHGDVSNVSGAALQAADTANGVTAFLRPEDGAWDPRPGHENDFYFVTTDRFNSKSQVGRSRLQRLRFDDITNPEAGGVIDVLLDGTEGGNMFDNICVDSHGRVLLQEDIGGNTPLGKIWSYHIESGVLTEVAAANPNWFIQGAPNFLTIDEEASGIFEAPFLGDGWYMINMQAHYPNGSELVEGGQLLALFVSPSVGAPCAPDFNKDGFLNSQDFFDFLTAFFAQDPSSDFNNDDILNSQDFFDFLAAFFVGC